MKNTVIGMDIAKDVFQRHAVDACTGEIERHKLRRNQVMEFFAQRAPAEVAMEACGGAHWWARQLQGLGHTVKLIAPHSVRPFVLRNKTDAADARAIWRAIQQPGARLVAAKSPAQQAILALHRMRSQLMTMRIMQSNGLRGMLYEFGEVLPLGAREMARALPDALHRLEACVPGFLLESWREQWARVQTLEAEIGAIERRLRHVLGASESCQSIAQIPGVGLLTATAAVAVIGDAKAYRSGREFAASLGLVPRQSGTGGRVRQMGISKRGDPYMRTLLMHAARSLINAPQRSPWIQALLARRAYNVVVAALANKLARTIWAVLARGQAYEPRAFSPASA